MSNPAVNHAAIRHQPAAWSVFARLIRNWKARRAVSRLELLNDYLLRDIGLTRAEVEWAAGLPLSINAGLALEQTALTRRRGDPSEY